MKIIYFLVLSLTVLSCSLGPCGSKSGFITNHEKFVLNTINDTDNLSTNDWKEKDEEFKTLVETCYETHKDELTPAEKRAFWELNAKYYVGRYGDKSSLGNIGLDVKRFITEDLDITMEDIEDEIRDVFDDDFKNDLEDLKDGLKEMTQDLRRELRDFLQDKDGIKEELKRELRGFLEDKKELKEELKNELKEILDEKDELKAEIEGIYNKKE